MDTCSIRLHPDPKFQSPEMPKIAAHKFADFYNNLRYYLFMRDLGRLLSGGAKIQGDFPGGRAHTRNTKVIELLIKIRFYGFLVKT